MRRQTDWARAETVKSSKRALAQKDGQLLVDACQRFTCWQRQVDCSVGGLGVPFCRAGKTTSLGGYKISGYVYFSGPTFPEYAVFAADTWGPKASEASANVILLNNLVPNKWIPFELSMVFGFQYDHVAFRLGPNGAWSGTMYLDDISFTGL